MILSRQEVEAMIAEAVKGMDGEGLANFYNTEFGAGLHYLGDEQFEHDQNERFAKPMIMINPFGDK